MLLKEHFNQLALREASALLTTAANLKLMLDGSIPAHIDDLNLYTNATLRSATHLADIVAKGQP